MKLSLPILLLFLKKGEVFFPTRTLRNNGVDKDWPRDWDFCMPTKLEPELGQDFKIIRYVDNGVVAKLVPKKKRKERLKL